MSEAPKRKRWRSVEAKPGQLVARYGREDRHNWPDLLYAWGGSGAGKPDSRVLMAALEEAKVFEGRSLRQELEARGYDITTLRFSIEKKPSPLAAEGKSEGADA